MTDNPFQFITEGTSLTSPSSFVGENYSFWKDKMEMCIKPTQYKIWLIITNGDIPIPRPKAEWTDDDLPIMELNRKTTYTLTCVL